MLSRLCQQRIEVLVPKLKNQFGGVLSGDATIIDLSTAENWLLMEELRKGIPRSFDNVSNAVCLTQPQAFYPLTITMPYSQSSTPLSLGREGYPLYSLSFCDVLQSLTNRSLSRYIGSHLSRRVWGEPWCEKAVYGSLQRLFPPQDPS